MTKKNDKPTVSEERAKADDIRTIPEMCELFGLNPYDDPEGKIKVMTIYEANEEYIDERAVYGYAQLMKLDMDDRANKPNCPECDGDGEVSCECEDGCEKCNTRGLVECPKCAGDGHAEIDFESDEWSKAVGEVADDLYKCWLRAVENVFDKYLDYFHLQAEQIRIKHIYVANGKAQPWFEDGYRIKPTKGHTWREVCVQIVETIDGVGYFWFNSARELAESIPTTSFKQAAVEHFHWMKDYGKVYGDASPASLYSNNIEHELRNW